MQTKATVLVIDDEQGIRDMLSLILRQEGYVVSVASDGKKGVCIAAEQEIDVVVTDMKMPGMDGMAVLDHVKKNKPQVEVIMATGYGSSETATESLRRGAFHCLNKPFDVEEFLLIVEKALEKKRLKSRAQ
jgi:DNA-binding NtrC family response regulator